jgi:hypothetical protein
MAKPTYNPVSGCMVITEQHKWHIMVSNGKDWELYDCIYSWSSSRKSALARVKAYHQFQRYLENTGRRFTLKYVSCESFPNRPLYLSKSEYKP